MILAGDVPGSLKYWVGPTIGRYPGGPQNNRVYRIRLYFERYDISFFTFFFFSLFLDRFPPASLRVSLHVSCGRGVGDSESEVGAVVAGLLTSVCRSRLVYVSVRRVSSIASRLFLLRSYLLLDSPTSLFCCSHYNIFAEIKSLPFPSPRPRAGTFAWQVRQDHLEWKDFGRPYRP